MLIGLTIDRFRGIAPSTLLKLARLVGVNFVEITHSVFDDLPAVLAELGPIKCGFHLPNYGDHGIDFSHESFKNEINQLIENVNNYHQHLHVQYCLAHPPEGHPTLSKAKNANSYLFDNLRKLRPPVIIENIQSMSFEEFQAFFEMAKDELGDKLIGQCYDPAHYFVGGEDPLAVLDRMKFPIATVHLSDCRADKDSHLPFNMGGVLPVNAIINKLYHMKYRNSINLELLPRSLDELDSIVASYLTVVRRFHPVRYLITRARMSMLLPLLQRKLRTYGKQQGALNAD